MLELTGMSFQSSVYQETRCKTSFLREMEGKPLFFFRLTCSFLCPRTEKTENANTLKASAAVMPPFNGTVRGTEFAEAPKLS